MTYFNNLGQGRVGWRSPGGGVTPSSLWTSVYAVYNADAVGSSSLKTSLYAAYNGESNANDSFGTNNGTAQGGLTYTTGKIGNAFNLNGSNAYVSLPDNSLNFTGDFSYSFWVKTNASGNYTLLGNYTYTGGLNYGYSVSLRGNDLYFQIANGAIFVNLIYTNSSGWSSQYNHITITRKNSTGSEIYVNGTKVISNTSSINPLYTNSHFPTIGASKDPAFYWPFNGQIDALSIWNKELTASEITELYNSGNGAQYITDSFYKPTTNDALNTYNGTAQGGLTYGVGKVGTAFVGNGSNAYVSLPNNSFNFTGDFSVSGWINQSSTPSYHMIMGNQNSTSVATGYSGWIVWVWNNKLTFDIYDNTTGAASGRWQTTITLATNTWIHFAVTKKPNQAAKIYLNGTINGQLIFGSNTANVSYLPTTYSVIGANKYSSLDGYWNGSIDALNVWNKELSASEITELYNSGNGKQYPN